MAEPDHPTAIPMNDHVLSCVVLIALAEMLV